MVDPDTDSNTGARCSQIGIADQDMGPNLPGRKMDPSDRPPILSNRVGAVKRNRQVEKFFSGVSTPRNGPDTSI